MSSVNDVVGHPDGDARGIPPVPRRHLVVANATLAGTELRRLVDERCAQGPAAFHVVVPRSPVVQLGGLVLGDPLSGYVSANGGEPYDPTADDLAAAVERLEQFVAAVSSPGATVSGEIGPSDPVQAVTRVLARAHFDEIIVSTLPYAVSRWLHLDLPRRLRRLGPVPVTHVEAVAAAVG
jgi:hypothetical protein